MTEVLAGQEGYIIEGAGVAWCGKSIHDFRPNYPEAVRFQRLCDADTVLHWILPVEYQRTCRSARIPANLAAKDSQ